MYVCQCAAVTDHEVNDEIARGAKTLDDLAQRCEAGAECGGCWPALEELLHARPRELAHALR
jgi:bacterioferritin-associated ferredoxin